MPGRQVTAACRGRLVGSRPSPLSRGEDVVPLVGARRRDQLAESPRALEVRITADDVARLESAFPRGDAAGDRYVTPLMAHLDSERRKGRAPAARGA